MNYGTKNVLNDEDMGMHKAKIRITTMIDYPVYEQLKSMAEESGEKYQTILNKILKQYFAHDEPEVRDLPPEFIKMLEELKGISKRVEKIEKKSKAG